jgi:hypothetical protein
MKALQALGSGVPDSERKQRVLGAGTVAVTKSLQTDLGLTAGVVNVATARAINVNLEALGRRYHPSRQERRPDPGSDRDSRPRVGEGGSKGSERGQPTVNPPRPNRISFYAFNLAARA